MKGKRKQGQVGCGGLAWGRIGGVEETWWGMMG